jgi:hypothetical protein
VVRDLPVLGSDDIMLGEARLLCIIWYYEVRARTITNGTLADFTPNLTLFNISLVYNHMNAEHSKH